LRAGDGMGHCPGDVGDHVQIEAALDHKRREWKCAICGVRSRLATASRQLRQWLRRSQGREHWRGIGRKGAWCGGVRQDESVDVLRVRDRVSGGEQAPIGIANEAYLIHMQRGCGRLLGR
jgi:hypothetical protein